MRSGEARPGEVADERPGGIVGAGGKLDVDHPPGHHPSVEITPSGARPVRGDEEVGEVRVLRGARAQHAVGVDDGVRSAQTMVSPGLRGAVEQVGAQVNVSWHPMRT